MRFLVSLTVASLAIFGPSASAETLAVVGGTIIDGNGGKPIDDGVIVIDDKRIVAVGGKSTAIPTQARRIAAAGKFVIPGLMDSNVHLVLDYAPATLVRYDGRYDEFAIEAAQVALRSGVTTVFDTWGPRRYLVKARDAVNEGRVIASRIYLAGNIVGLGGPMSENFDMSYPQAREALFDDFSNRIDAEWQENVGPELRSMSPEQVRQEIRKYVQKGVDFVKYAVNDHSKTGNSILFSPRVQQVIVEEAHLAGKPVTTHTSSVEGVYLAVQAGVDVMQHCHATAYPIPAETLALIVQRHIGCSFFFSSLPKDVKVSESSDQHASATPSTLEETDDISNKLALMHAGAVVLLMTDGGIFCSNTINSPWWTSWNSPKEGLHMLGEGHFLWLLAVERLGMKPMDALMAATSNIAKAYKVDKDLGTIEKGKIADLVILDKNPLEGAANYRSITLVMKEGRVVDRESLPKAAGRAAGC